MRATTSKRRENSSGLLEITAKEGNPADIAHMLRTVAYLVENEGYEEIYGEEDYHITLGTHDNTEEMLKAYARAKKETARSDLEAPDSSEES